MTEVTDQVRTTLDAVVRRQFPDAGVADVRVTEDTDHDGEDVLRIDVILAKHQKLDGRALVSLVRLLREELVPLSESRFPIVSFMTAQDLEDRTAAA